MSKLSSGSDDSNASTIHIQEKNVYRTPNKWSMWGFLVLRNLSIYWMSNEDRISQILPEYP